MTRTEQRLTDALASLAEHIDDTARPSTLDRAPLRRERRGSRWPLVGAVAAAVAVVVVGLSVLAWRDTDDRAAQPAPTAPATVSTTAPQRTTADLSVAELARLLPAIPAGAVGLGVGLGDAKVEVVDAGDSVAGSGAPPDVRCVRIDVGATAGHACADDGSSGLVAVVVGEVGTPRHLALAVNASVSVSSPDCEWVIGTSGESRLFACLVLDDRADVEVRFDTATATYTTTFSWAPAGSALPSGETPTSAPAASALTIVPALRLRSALRVQEAVPERAHVGVDQLLVPRQRGLDEA